MKRFLKSIMSAKMIRHLQEIKTNILDGYSTKSYSQEGEDMILRRYFESKEKGFYVDVGAHHPQRFSNTYYFYKRGWHGINVDAMPGSMKLFNKRRPRDTNIEQAVAKDEKELVFNMMNEPALNSFVESLSEERINKNQQYKLAERVVLRTKTLEHVLDEHLPKNQEIDFMTIDVEGLDFDVIQSNNWKRYRPEMLLIEILNSTMEDIVESEITAFLHREGYQLMSKCVNTVFFMRNKTPIRTNH